MNLRAIANSATQAVNPNISGSVQVSCGYKIGANYNQVPKYEIPASVALQVQALTKREVEHLDGMNMSNATRSAYANLQLTGVDRTKKSGGDLLTFIDPGESEPSIWLVIAVLEAWTTAGWCKVALARQLAS